jgi:hypothetical protein
MYTWRLQIEPKHVVYIYNKENESERQPKLHVDAKEYKTFYIWTSLNKG